MTEIQNSKPSLKQSKYFDLEKRTFFFSKKVREFVKKLTKNITNLEDIPQLINASGSVGANYIEANEALSKKDFFMRIKISRKEAKEARYWLQLIDVDGNKNLDLERKQLIQEATEN